MSWISMEDEGAMARPVGWCIAGLCVLLAAGPAAAQAKAGGTLAVHPLAFVTPDEAKHAKVLEAAFADAVQLHLSDRVPPEEVEKFFAAGGRAPCDSDEGEGGTTTCLAMLARTTGAQRALLVRVSLWPVMVAGEWVGSDERAFLLPAMRATANDSERLEAAKRLLSEFVIQHVASLPPLEPAPLVAVPSRPAPGGGADLRRMSGMGLVALGVAGLAGGGWAHLEWAQRHEQAEAMRLQHLPPERLGELARLQQSGRTRQTWRAVGLGAGVAAVGAGVFLLTAAPRPTAAGTEGLSVGVSIAPEHVSLVGRF